MNSDKDSVVNFLTPTKLVYGSIKSKPRNNLYQSQQTNSSQRQKQEQMGQIPSYSFTAQFDKLNRDIDRSRDRQSQNSQYDRKEPSRPPSDRNYNLNNANNCMLKSEDNYKFYYDNKAEEKLSETSKPPNKLQPVQNYAQHTSRDEPSSRAKQSSKNSRVEDLSRVSKQKQKQQYPLYIENNNNMIRWDGSTDELVNLMKSLKGVKQLIDVELSELQQLLDNTSRYLNDINDQYIRIKQRIMDYTSQVLDASFTKYKDNMVNWTKYEDVQKRTIVIMNQLEKSIKEDEIIVEQMIRNAKGPRIAIGKQQQIQQKIQFYGNYANQLKASKTECAMMRPQLKKDRIQQFEKALAHLCQF